MASGGEEQTGRPMKKAVKLHDDALQSNEIQGGRHRRGNTAKGLCQNRQRGDVEKLAVRMTPRHVREPLTRSATRRSVRRATRWQVLCRGLEGRTS